MSLLWTLAASRDKGARPPIGPVPGRVELNVPVTVSAPDPATSYRLAPALGARLVGRSLVTLAVLVALATVVGVLTGAGWVPAGVVAAIGALLAAGWGWYLLRLAWAVRLTEGGYAVRLLAGVGASAASWSQVEKVVAASPGGTPCLVLQLRDGRLTRLPMAAIAGDPDAFALDVRRRVRDAHTPRQTA